MALRIPVSALITYILVILFGSSSWISVNGTWIQLPLMVNVLPEGWALPSYLAVIVQLAFVGPLLYAVAKKLLFPYLSAGRRRRNDGAALFRSLPALFRRPTPLIYVSLIVAVVCQFLLALFWDRTSFWSTTGQQQNRSTALFILFFFLSLINCLSNVLYLPYMFRFRPSYTTAYFVGMGFSALVPSVLGLIQGSGRIDCVSVVDEDGRNSEENSTFTNNETATTTTRKYLPKPVLPLFGVGVFYGVLSFWLAVVVVGFYALNRLPQLRTERNDGDDNAAEAEAENPAEETPPETVEPEPELPETEGMVHHRRSSKDQKGGGVANNDESIINVENPTSSSTTLSRPLYIYLLLVTALVCALLNGVLPSIQSFATLPYGQMTYHLAVTISNLANPVACFVPFFIRIRRLGLIVTIWLVIGNVLAGFIMATAVYSPTPMWGGRAGPVFSVISWTLVTGIFSYLRTLIAGAFRESSGGAGGESRLFWCGLFTQGGAFIGAMTIFPLVNVWQVFHTAPSCPP